MRRNALQMRYKNGRNGAMKSSEKIFDDKKTKQKLAFYDQQVKKSSFHDISWKSAISIA